MFSFQVPEMYNVPFWTGNAYHEQTEVASSDTLYAPESGPESTFFSPALPISSEKSPVLDFRARAIVEPGLQEDPYTAIPFSTPGPGKSDRYTRPDVLIKPANASSNLVTCPTALSTASLAASARIDPPPSAFQRVNWHSAPSLSSVSSSVPRSPGSGLFRKPSIPRESSYDIDNPFTLSHTAHAYPSASDRQSAYSNVRSAQSVASPTLLNAAEPLAFHSPLLAQQSHYGDSKRIPQAHDAYASLPTHGELPDDEEPDVFAFSLPLPTGSHTTSNAGQGPVKDVKANLQDLPPSDGTSLPEYEPLEPYDPPIKHRSLSGLFSKPGPTYGVYFDSPTEDPSSSPLSSPHVYPLDVEELDFRWTPFVRDNQKTNLTLSPRIRQSDERAYSPVPRSSEPDADPPMAPSFRSMPTLVLNEKQDEDMDEDVDGEWEVSIRSHYQLPPSSLPVDNNEPESEDEDALAFAPAPGIFISPLHDGPEEEAPQPVTDAAPFPVPSPPPSKDVVSTEEDVPQWTVLEASPAVGFYLGGSPPRTPPRRAVPISVMNARLVRRGSGLPEDERYEKDSIESWTPGEGCG
ncbi:hypothetical protein EWM64_g5459 [Hericium alpestre]|uniref:Uncharacterized protein n=1 Tax=Hericium alpestre TaxID=135208 RepID=A0A4Y9ZWK7_9AGAM|nr:hypothetical protein EWM64_g5459 [Hericium alpestre]